MKLLCLDLSMGACQALPGSFPAPITPAEEIMRGTVVAAMKSPQFMDTKSSPSNFSAYFLDVQAHSANIS